MEIKFSYNVKNKKYGRNQKWARCFVSLPDGLVSAAIGEFPHPGTRRGEDPAADAACDRWNRGYIRIARGFAAARLAEEFGIADVRMRWDENAGCSMCRCSPGFVVNDPRVSKALKWGERWVAEERAAGVGGWYPVERWMWVTVEEPALEPAIAA